MRKKRVSCLDNSPTYRKILKEKSKGYKLYACEKTWKILTIKPEDSLYNFI